MKITALAFGLFAAAFLLHWLIWRIRIPRRQTFALLIILMGALPAGLGAVYAIPALADWRPLNLWQLLHVAEFHVAVSLAYIVAYSALEGRSPSMTLLLFVADSRGNGRTRAELESLLRGQRPVESRLEAMLRDAMVAEHDGIYRLTEKGWAWARVLGGARRFLKMGKGG